MANDYIDLVVCEEYCEIFCAPAFSHLKKGDRVIVENKDGDAEAVVERSYTTKYGDGLDFILIANGSSLPLKKVLKKVTYIDFAYEDGDEKSRIDSKT